MIHWKQIDEFIEPNWEKVDAPAAANLFWRGKKGAVFGYIRDGELFDHRWQYVCDANKIIIFQKSTDLKATWSSLRTSDLTTREQHEGPAYVELPE